MTVQWTAFFETHQTNREQKFFEGIEVYYFSSWKHSKYNGALTDFSRAGKVVLSENLSLARFPRNTRPLNKQTVG